MAFSVNTNIASLQAQNYLRTSSDFQSKTINRVTSGLRIVSSGDDAAGLAIANGFRSDEAVLSQGIRNAGDGLSTLQTIDGGMNNISQLLDRARTLATQSASGTFTGGASGRAQLNSEFQSVITEIDRQAQSIGLNVGGEFAKSLSVFLGGGRTSGSTDSITNGSVSVDLSTSTVDARSLGLKSFQAKGADNTDIGSGAASTTVEDIVNDTTNKGDLARAGWTDFYFYGAGFSTQTSDKAVKVSVNLSGVSSTDDLLKQINSAISSAGSQATQEATAFRNAGISASIVTDDSGKQQLAFSSSKEAFQVRAGDMMSNALMGNFDSGAAGKQAGTIAEAGGATNTGGTNKTDNLTISGGLLSTSYTFAVTAAGGATTLDDWVAGINSAITGADTTGELAGLGVKAVVDSAGKLAIRSNAGIEFNVLSNAGAAANYSGFSRAAAGTDSVVATDYTEAAGASTTDTTPGSAVEPFTFVAPTTTQTQTLTFGATDAAGTLHTKSITLTAANSGSIDEAMKTINDALQQTNDSTLNQIFAASDKISTGGTGIRFASSLASFDITVGSTDTTTPYGIGADSVANQGTTFSATTQGSGGTADISTIDGAKAAVTALATAVTTLGDAQAVVGKGQNNFNYAINLAQSQVTNLAAAESRIRDADLASEAANLSKAQILMQAGTAALAQANSAPQAILSLLRG